MIAEGFGRVKRALQILEYLLTVSALNLSFKLSRNAFTVQWWSHQTVKPV